MEMINIGSEGIMAGLFTSMFLAFIVVGVGCLIVNFLSRNRNKLNN